MPTETPSSVAIFQAQIMALQSEFMQKIQRAQSSNDLAAIQAVSAEFQQKLSELTAGFQTNGSGNGHAEGNGHAVVSAPPVKEDPTAHLYDNPHVSVDLNLTVYDGERNMLWATLQDKHFMDLAEKILGDDPAFNSRKHLLKGALRLSPAIAPQVFDILKVCKERLGLTIDLDVYVYQDTAFNASCFPSGQDRIYVLLTSALLERFNTDELTFVLGHEIGHAVMNHHRFPIQVLLEQGSGHFSPLQALRLYSWNRGCEVSCDRIGLLCSRNFEAAGKAFFKLSSGITHENFSFQLQDYIKQFEDLSSELKNSEIDPEDMYSSHPFSPLRLKALEIFWKSETYHKLIGETGGEIPEAAMEDQIRGFMSLVEPLALQEDAGEMVQKAKRFIFGAGYKIAAANGVVDASELEALSSLLDPVMVQQELTKIQQTTPEALEQELETLAESLNMAMPVVSKLNMLRDLAVISSADGSIEPSEVDVLYHCCELLHIRTAFVDRVVDEMTSSKEE